MHDAQPASRRTRRRPPPMSSANHVLLMSMHTYSMVAHIHDKLSGKAGRCVLTSATLLVRPLSSSSGSTAASTAAQSARNRIHDEYHHCKTD